MDYVTVTDRRYCVTDRLMGMWVNKIYGDSAVARLWLPVGCGRLGGGEGLSVGGVCRVDDAAVERFKACFAN